MAGRQDSVPVTSIGLSDQGPLERRQSQRPHQSHEVEKPESRLVPVGIRSTNRILCTPLQLSGKKALHSTAFTLQKVMPVEDLPHPVCSLSGSHASSLGVIRMESTGPILQLRQLRPRLSNFPVDVNFE